MNDIWSAYLNMFQQTKPIKTRYRKNIVSVINEDAEDDTDKEDEQFEQDDDEGTDDQQDTNDDQSNDQDNEEKIDDQESASDKQQKAKKSADLNFSADLAAQFGNTCNKFTNLAAKVVKERTVGKETADELTKILQKLKSLINAANNSI